MKRFITVLFITAGITGVIGGIGETSAYAKKRGPEGGAACASEVVADTPAAEHLSLTVLSHLDSLCDEGDGGGGQKQE